MPGLRELAAKHFRHFVEGDANGWRWPITLRTPSGNVVDGMYCFSNDIEAAIDPETGQLVSGRSATVSIPIQSLYDRGLALPKSVVDEDKKPWVIMFDDIHGKPHKFTVKQSLPDRTIGNLVLILELYG